MHIQMQSAQPHTSMCFGFLLGLFFTITIFLQIVVIPIVVSWSAGFIERVFKLLINSCICSFVHSCPLPSVLCLLKATHRAALSCQSLLLSSVAGQAKTTLVWIILLLQCRSCHEEWLREGKKSESERECVCVHKLRLGKWEWCQWVGKEQRLLLSKVSARAAGSSCCAHLIDSFTRIIALQSKYSFFLSLIL